MAPPSQRFRLIARAMAEFRHSLSYIDALPQLTFLGFLVGILTGIIIVAFRGLVELPLTWLLPGHGENFEALSPHERVFLITLGIAAVIGLVRFLTVKDREIGVSHVLDRMHNHQAKLPLRNCVVQFAGAVICLISGQSAGREGPVVHLGAGAASQFASWLRLPNNSITILTGCGVAAAISASFDTPLAGVIFAMEVLALEYTIVGFVPVILASVMGTLMSKAAFGGSTFIIAGDIGLSSLAELPLLVAAGFILAVCAGIYIRLNILALGFLNKGLSPHLITARLAIAGVLTIAVVSAVPQVMGQGYDTVNGALSGAIFAPTLLLIAVAKLCLTPVVMGLGLPGGVIGPLLVIGACVGGAIGSLATLLFPHLEINAGFYVLVGMTGMMAATLNAPLTALVTVLELSVNPNTLFPSMLVIVVASVSTRQLFKVKGIFVEQLLHSNRPLDFGPAKQALRRVGVRSVMDTRFTIVHQKISPKGAYAILAPRPSWLIITDENDRYSNAMHAADLANHLQKLAEPAAIDDEKQREYSRQAIAPNVTGPSRTNPETLTPEAISSKLETVELETIDLLEIPSRTFRIGAIHESASLYEAMQSFSTESMQVLYVSGEKSTYADEVKGVLTLSAIENYYQPVEFRHAVD